MNIYLKKNFQKQASNVSFELGQMTSVDFSSGKKD